MDAFFMHQEIRPLQDICCCPLKYVIYERLKKDTWQKGLVHTRILEVQRVRNYRNSQSKVSHLLSLQHNVSESFRLIQMEVATWMAQSVWKGQAFADQTIERATWKASLSWVPQTYRGCFPHGRLGVSHNLAHKCSKQAGIRSKARKNRYVPPGEESVIFPNRVCGNWDASHPM